MNARRTRRGFGMLLSLAAAFTWLAACSGKAPVTTENSSTAGPAGNGPVVAAAGSDFYGRLQQTISSKTSKDGDAFALAQTDTFLHKSPALHGAVINGHLENVQAAGPMRKPSMTLVFDNIQLPNGTRAPVDVELLSLNAFEPKSHRLRTIGLMVAGAVAGHEMSKHTGHGHGALLGAAGGYMLSQSLKTDISVPAGSVLELRFKSPVSATM